MHSVFVSKLWFFIFQATAHSEIPKKKEEEEAVEVEFKSEKREKTNAHDALVNQRSNEMRDEALVKSSDFMLWNILNCCIAYKCFQLNASFELLIFYLSLLLVIWDFFRSTNHSVIRAKFICHFTSTEMKFNTWKKKNERQEKKEQQQQSIELTVEC